MPVFTLENSYNQLAAICNDLVNNNTTTNDESVFDIQEETETTAVLSDSCITKAKEFKTIVVAENILLQKDQELNTLEIIKREEGQESARYSKGRYICVKCDKEMGKLSFLAIHNRSHTSKIHFTCPQCQCIFHALDDLSDHCQKHSMVPISCPKCEECFEDSRLFKMHLEIHIIEIEGNDEETRVNDEELPDIDKSLLYDKIYCLNEKVLVLSLGTSRAIYRESFPCKYCSVICTSKVRLSIHLLAHKEYVALTADKIEVSPI